MDKTLTFVSNDANRNNINNTYSISIGHKGDDYNVIKELYLLQLRDLGSEQNNKIYSWTLKKDIRVHLELIVTLGDQPERRDINYLMNGNSVYGSRYGFSSTTTEISGV